MTEAESDSMCTAFLFNPILVYLDRVLSKNEGCIRVYLLLVLAPFSPIVDCKYPNSPPAAPKSSYFANKSQLKDPITSQNTDSNTITHIVAEEYRRYASAIYRPEVASESLK